MPDPFVPPPALSTIKFLLVILVVQAMLLYVVYRTSDDSTVARRRVLLTAFAFGLAMLGSAILAESGFLEADPIRAVIFAAACMLLALVLALSRPGAAMATAVAPAYWVIFQGFRVPLEIVLHTWGEAGSIPVQMTWSGQNFDIVAGLLALVLGFAWLRRPGATWPGYAAHVIGLALLANVGRIAATSLPTPLRTFEGAPLLLPFHAPYIWILPFAVAAALYGHVVGLRAIRGGRGRVRHRPGGTRPNPAARRTPREPPPRRDDRPASRTRRPRTAASRPS